MSERDLDDGGAERAVPQTRLLELSQISTEDRDSAPTEPEIFTTKDRDSARFMGLDGAVTSDAAREMVQRLAEGLYEASGTGKRGKPSKAYVEAVAALLSDHLRNADPDPKLWGYCSHRREEFSGQRIGYRPFKSAFDAMVSTGLLLRVAGHQQHAEFGGNRVRSWAKSTRSRATAKLMNMAMAAGITPASHPDHFELVEREVPHDLKDPLEVRKGSTRVGAVKYKGFPLPLDRTDPAVADLHERMVRLNEYFSHQEIGGLPHRAFRRIFNDGGSPDYAWNKGGRLSSVGGNSYQNAKKAERASMTINGEDVVELDITASHLTILHALARAEFDPSHDPYEVDGLPRDVVKAWVTMSLGHVRFHVRWPKDARERLEKKLTVPLGKTYPISNVRERVIADIPLLADWEANPIDWADLQYIESCAVLEAIERLAYQHSVPCLPVHDSIIVPASKEELARHVLMSAFKVATGVFPHVKAA